LGTEKLGYSVVILLTVSLVLSMLLIATPVSATSATAPSSPVLVPPGGVFLLRGSITFDQPDTGYFIYGPVYWYNYGNENENFKLENTPSVYWTNCTDNALLNGLPVDNVAISDYHVPNGWQVDIADDGSGIALNGTFNIDIWLRAIGLGGILHAPGHENIYFSANQITLFEPFPTGIPAGPIDVTVTALPRGVNVSASPTPQYGWAGDNLVYNVKVQNTGSIAENFTLTLENTLTWQTGGLPATIGPIAAGDNWTGPIWAVVAGSPGDDDNLTVTAKSMDNAIENTATCRAHHAQAGVDILIDPQRQDNYPGDIVFTVTVTNTGELDDNFTLENSDNSGWPLSLEKVVIEPIRPTEFAITTLTVTLNENVPGCTTDNITVKATSGHDNTVSENATCTVHRVIVRGVQVVIEPSSQENDNGGTLTYTVTVNNTGNVQENFQLTKGDNAGWGLNLADNWLLVSKGGTGTTNLTVTIPTNAIGGTFDNIWVKATSQDNAAVFDNKSCLAQVKIARGVDVLISPDYQENVRRENVAFTVIVKNTGNVLDNYALTVGDNENWGPKLNDNLFVNIAPGDNKTTTLRITIPDNAVPGTEDNITVTATSQTDNTIKDNDSCLVHVVINRGVRVSISPGENSAFPGEDVTFAVTVTNTSDNSDNFVLHASDNLHWGLSLADNLMENIAPGGSRTTKLTVSIPENAAIDARDNITVTATSRENENVTYNATCTAHSTAITMGVMVSISPAEEEGMQSSGLSYTVAVTNTGNIIDNYNLTVSDNAGWSPSISEGALEVPAGENRTATLSATVPDNAAPSTSDRITVTATSQKNGAITSSASCVGRALLLERVEVKISPGYLSGYPKDTLYFTVYVTNAGRARDSFNLRTTASGSWLSQVEPPLLTLDAGETENAILSVLIPADAKEGDTGIVEVRAISTTNSLVQSADTCRAIVFAAKPGGVLSIPWIQILLIAALIAGIVFTVGYLTRRRGRGRRRGVLNK
jgi:uncharacterized membrane protein